MKGSIDGILKQSNYFVLGHTMMMLNKAMNDTAKLGRLRATTISVRYVPSEMRARYRANHRKDGRVIRTILQFDPFGDHND